MCDSGVLLACRTQWSRLRTGTCQRYHMHHILSTRGEFVRTQSEQMMLRTVKASILKFI